jgi:hypothetical protein
MKLKRDLIQGISLLLDPLSNGEVVCSESLIIN